MTRGGVAGDLTTLKWSPIERRKGMGKQISRRKFLQRSAIALGTVAVYDFEGIGGAGIFLFGLEEFVAALTR